MLHKTLMARNSSASDGILPLPRLIALTSSCMDEGFLTLIRAGFLVDLNSGGGGGWNQDNRVFGLLRPHFSPKSTKHGLKWELECLSTYRISENHPMFCSFSVPWPWSSLVWARKFFSFRHENFWKFIIFDLHRQYVHQMKAEIILNSNLTSKSTIF